MDMFFHEVIIEGVVAEVSCIVDEEDSDDDGVGEEERVATTMARGVAVAIIINIELDSDVGNRLVIVAGGESR